MLDCPSIIAQYEDMCICFDAASAVYYFRRGNWCIAESVSSLPLPLHPLSVGEPMQIKKSKSWPTERYILLCLFGQKKPLNQWRLEQKVETVYGSQRVAYIYIIYVCVCMCGFLRLPSWKIYVQTCINKCTCECIFESLWIVLRDSKCDCLPFFRVATKKAKSHMKT